MKFERILKTCLVVSILGVIIFGLMTIVEIKETLEVEMARPTFEKHASVYHGTPEINLALIMDNGINNFYTWFDLTPEQENEVMKIYGYGPIEDPVGFRLRVMIVCNQHGRELVTGEICFSMVRLLQKFVQDPVYMHALGDLEIANVGFWVVPVANPWARQQAQFNESMLCRRTNKRGVDLNRNYPSFLQRRSDGPTEEYKGTHPFSEYETVAVAKFLDDSDAHVLINVHSGGTDILLPYDGRVNVPPLYSEMVNFAKNARDALKLRDCRVSMSSSLYGAHEDEVFGTLGDYAIDTGSVDLAYTLEVFYDQSVENVGSMDGVDCHRFFNPREGESLLRVQQRWIDFILALCKEILENLKN